MKKQYAFFNNKNKLLFHFLIEKKCKGYELSEHEIQFLVESILYKKIPKYQLSSLLMAINFQGLTAQETAFLAEEIMLSGDLVNLSKTSSPKIDKYSIGGVGDKTTLVLSSISAACGIIVPGMYGIDEDYSISFIDKIKSIPGMKCQLNPISFANQLCNMGFAISEPHHDIAPVDNILYLLRKETGTIPCLSLITASILSKKFAQGSEGLVIDVKWGNGSFIKEIDQAKQLARSITRVSRLMKKRCVALVTNMNQPLGNCVGTSLEIIEAINLLKNQGSNDLKELILKLGMEMVRLAGVAGSTLSAKQTVKKVLEDGSAFQKFKQIIHAQGGDISFIENPNKFLKAKYIKKLPAPKRGYIYTIDSGMIAKGVRRLSFKQDILYDSTAGVSNIQKIGTQVKQGEPLMMIHYNNESRLEEALEYFKNAYKLTPKRPNIPELIIERVA